MNDGNGLVEVTDELFARMKEHFSDKQIVGITGSAAVPVLFATSAPDRQPGRASS